MALYVNNGSDRAPRLEIWLNLDTLDDLHRDSIWPAGLESDPLVRDLRLAADGFEGVQVTHESGSPSGQLPHCGLDRVSIPSEADAIIVRHADRGDRCLTLHVGWGSEDDAGVDRLVEAVLAASQKHRLPVFIETHRATITQDVWRTVRITRAFPEVRFNGDFSHYYCGQEMPYGDWQARLEFMNPIFARIGFLHGRIASPGCIQAVIGADGKSRAPGSGGHTDYLEHFRDLWTHAMRGFRAHAPAGSVLIFAPELLSRAYDYARVFPDANGRLVEESDRYAQALLLQRLARECFAEAGS